MAKKKVTKKSAVPKVKAPEVPKRYAVRVGTALLGQPQVRLELPEQAGGHTFFRRKRGEDGVFVNAEDEAWEVTITPRRAAKLEDEGYLVTEVKNTKAADAAKE